MALGQKLQQLYLHPRGTRKNTLRAVDGLALGSCCLAVAPGFLPSSGPWHGWWPSDLPDPLCALASPLVPIER